ncbi:NmrA family NAD(P)-binding protein [Longispora urticae]
MTFLVTGATGTVGRQVVGQLLRAGQRVRALTRNPATAGLPDGVEVVAGDLTDPASVAPALQGVTGLHLITFGGGGANPYAPLATGPEIVDLAVRAGVRRITVLLGGAPGPLQAAVEASGLEWTHLAPVEFMANLLEWAPSVRSEGVVREAFARTRSALVHETDIGAVAATVLVEGGYAGRTLTLTGPEAVTRPEKVRTIAEAIGREVRYVELSEAEARARWAGEGYPAEVIEFFVEVHGNTPEIGYTVVPTVEQVTGRPARSFEQWAAEHADAFRG